MDPAEVWRLIVRADELLKYASGRDPAEVAAQAREALNRATDALERLSDPRAAEALREQIRRRLADVDATGR